MREFHNLSKKKGSYRSWTEMKARCLDTNNIGYFNYGGRGISVCARWKNSFITFFADMGPRPAAYTLDRLDPNGNYCKENCKWATRKEQANNRRNNRPITFNGKTQNISQWAEEVNLPWATIRQRIARGWSIEKALTTINCFSHNKNKNK